MAVRSPVDKFVGSFLRSHHLEPAGSESKKNDHRDGPKRQAQQSVSREEWAYGVVPNLHSRKRLLDGGPGGRRQTRSFPV